MGEVEDILNEVKDEVAFGELKTLSPEQDGHLKYLVTSHIRHDAIKTDIKSHKNFLREVEGAMLRLNQEYKAELKITLEFKVYPLQKQTKLIRNET